MRSARETLPECWAREGGFEYSLILLALSLSFIIRGGGPYLLDRRLGREI